MTFLAHMACWGCVALLVHVFVGYPAMMWALAKVSPRPVRRAPITPSVTVVIAVHDGGRQIRAKLSNLRALDYPAELIDIVISCDGCRDATAALARTCGDLRVRVLDNPARRGKAACLNDAVAIAHGDVLLFTDLRQKLSPGALRELVANLADPTVGAVSGELHMENVLTGFAQGVDAYWRYEKIIRQAESQSGSTVGVSGALYAMRRELYSPLPAGTVLDDVLVPMRVAAAGQRVIFEPRALAWDKPSQHPDAERKRKIRTLAGNYQLVQLAPWLIWPASNPLWFRFVSHKLLRLLAPWMLVVLTLSSAALATRHAVYALMFFGIVCAAGLVLAGRLRPRLARWLPVRLAVAFYYLNLFAAQALLAFARNRGLHLW
ncbi:cellulose synthase/poly-beta-1,6-N-acetylglucosamine synthase-like glycosyltransferase [Luteibacter rhizovicinus]|uniref:Cellulose synthase/poly-beta-1,6-N-acetylglucosamine synthase-like glycosyltransferase n=1 Tax=Luteibacter rhizovicinus TaxID=242606 RepID=A0A4R3YY91_9GAMM|nr:glycosyltransferase family 2 protein [Luteibacter rhizovicinus]TCV97620.1 cellulose synthase/poly-beta-1,6-N-acetylglucosamine synthase-like glycosyltransferase [Luteibacter rhizovicinus]